MFRRLAAGTFLAWPTRGRIAQLVEQLTLNQRVVGSNPTAPTIPRVEMDVGRWSLCDREGFDLPWRLKPESGFMPWVHLSMRPLRHAGNVRV